MLASQDNKALAGEGLQLVASVNLQEALDALFGDDAKDAERKESRS